MVGRRRVHSEGARARDGLRGTPLGTRAAYRRGPRSAQERPEEERVTKLRSFTTAYAANVTAAAEAHATTVQTLADIAADLNQLGPSVNLLSQVSYARARGGSLSLPRGGRPMAHGRFEAPWPCGMVSSAHL